MNTDLKKKKMVKVSQRELDLTGQRLGLGVKIYRP